MLLKPFSTDDHQWLQRQRLLDELSDLAALAITESPQARQQLKIRFDQFIYAQSFDAVFGGLLVKEESDAISSLYYKPVITNIYLCELLIAADHVFYSGEYSSLARKIVSQISAWLTESKKGLIETNKFYQLKNLSASYDKHEIENDLESNELCLLNSLTNYRNSNDQTQRIISYSCSLRDAADNIDMHYKQSQIIEHSIVNKLITHSKTNTVDRLVQINLLPSNCDLLVALSYFQMHSNENDLSEILNHLFSEIVLQASSHNFDKNHLIDIVFSCLIFLQISFDTSVLKEIIPFISLLSSYVLGRNLSNNFSKKQSYQIALIDSFVQQFNIVFNFTLAEVEILDKKKSSNRLEPFQVIFLNKNNVDLNMKITDLRSKYNSRQLIYIINHEHFSIPD